jgi:hypothetical protein
MTDRHPTQAQLAHAQRVVWGFTLAAAAKGAIPVPGMSIAIVANNTALIFAVADALGVPISIADVAQFLGTAAAANQVGRRAFVEIARGMGWAAGPFGVAGVALLGAATGATQTWAVGQAAIAVGRRGHALAIPLSGATALVR